MTENKLTLEDCFKYSEAEIRHNSGRFKSVFELIIGAYNSNLSASFMLKDYDCKLILRDISQLTDEEKDFIVKEFSFRGRLLGSAFFENVEVLLINCSVDKRVGLIDYFRKQNIMIEPEDWFKSGKAVKDDNNN